MESTREILTKLAAAAEILDEVGLFADADLVDDFMKRAADEPDIEKIAGMWANFVSRLGGWARKLLFKEYRDLYARAKNAQAELEREAHAYLSQAQGWVENAKELQKMLKHHQMQEWRRMVGDLLSTMRVEVAPVLGPYDEQYGKMVAKVLRIAPQELPQRQPPRPGEAAPPTAPAGAAEQEEITPETVPGTPAAPEPETPAAPETAPEPETPAAPEAAPEPVAPEEAPPAEEKPSVAPAPPGWRKERFGRTRSRREPGGHIWEWEVSDDNSRLRMPRRDLADVSQGRGMILRASNGLYRTTGPVSRKLKELMGDVYWKAEDDPDNPGMAILARTDEAVPHPAPLRPPPEEQVEKIRALRGAWDARMERLLAIAEAESGVENAATETESGSARPKTRMSLMKIVRRYAGSIDPRVAMARIMLESGGNPKTIAPSQQWHSGRGSEIGLLQMSPDTRAQYGITEKQAMDPETNIRVQMRQWNAWAHNFFKDDPPADAIQRNAWSWLVTAVGPGAAAKLRSMAKGYDLGSLLRAVSDPAAMLAAKAWWGSQSPGLVSQRVKTAIQEVTNAMR